MNQGHPVEGGVETAAGAGFRRALAVRPAPGALVPIGVIGRVAGTQADFGDFADPQRRIESHFGG